jgi:hypothetical protein
MRGGKRLDDWKRPGHRSLPKPLRKAWRRLPEPVRAPLRRALVRRRFQAFCVGLSRTGTHSLAHMCEANYRSGHEVNAGLLDAICGRLDASLDDRAVERILQRRDGRLLLEMDSANPLVFVIEDLVRLFPEARFILTIRHVLPWLESRVDNHRYWGPTRTQWLPTWEARYGRAAGHPPEEQVLAEHGLFTLDGYLAGWTAHYRRVLAGVPSDRRLVVRTHEIARSLVEIANFLGIEASTLDAGRTHEGRSHVRYRMLERIDPGYLRAKIRQHCAELMARFFPEYDLLDRPAQGRAAAGAAARHG